MPARRHRPFDALAAHEGTWGDPEVDTRLLADHDSSSSTTADNKVALDPQGGPPSRR
ncbi:hypothetical protein ACFCYH_18310 [Streptomyces sp. NPDC056400]|uniref:hypothetical protein n=1 Tax=Streptomyces sp. NPDC056400 TaxID=3345808 RepID=UPI0035DD25EA